jgi:YegS/Rv2252/BmrU family lipid kinase
MKTAVIFNPVSGRGRSLDILPKVLAWAAKQKIAFKFYSTTRPGDGVRLAKLCKLEQFDKVVVIGGDGTVNEVGSPLIGTDIVMGVIPGGSGNDFYKMLGNDGRLENGLKTAFFGAPHMVDVGIVNDRPFFNAVGVGFDADVALRASRSTGMSGMLVYLAAVFRSWQHLKPVELEIELDKHRFTENVTLVCIGNGRSSGGGFYLTPQARFDDGLFDICLIEAIPKGKIFTFLPRTLKGSHVRLPGVKIYRSKMITINSYRKFPVHIDGEPLTQPIDLAEFSMESRKLKVVVAGKK